MGKNAKIAIALVAGVKLEVVGVVVVVAVGMVESSSKRAKAAPGEKISSESSVKGSDIMIAVRSNSNTVDVSKVENIVPNSEGKATFGEAVAVSSVALAALVASFERLDEAVPVFSKMPLTGIDIEMRGTGMPRMKTRHDNSIVGLVARGAVSAADGRVLKEASRCDDDALNVAQSPPLSEMGITPPIALQWHS